MRYIFGLTMALFCLTGCVVPAKAYRQPESGETARLLMRGQVGQGDVYNVFIYEDTENCGGPQKVGAGRQGDDPPAVKIGANGPVTVGVVFTRPDRRYCQLRWTFYPKVNQSYLIQTAMDNRGCTALLMDASNPDKLIPETTALRRDNGANWCVPLAQSVPFSEIKKHQEQQSGQYDLPVVKDGNEPKINNSLDEDLKSLIGGKS